jgi:predicted metallopeptidase
MFTPKLNTDYNHIEVPETYLIRNNTTLDYIDKVASVGLQAMGMDTVFLQIYPMKDETLVKSKEKSDVVGRIIAGPIGTNQYILQIDENMSVRDIIKTTAHEIIHIEQYQSGKLKIDRDADGTITGLVEWNGWSNYDVFKLNYEDYPWEKDAYKRDDALYRTMMDELYGSLEKIMK